jgi:hypothetical protein
LNAVTAAARRYTTNSAANGARHEHRKSGNFAAFGIVRYFSDAESV